MGWAVLGPTELCSRFSSSFSSSLWTLGAGIKDQPQGEPNSLSQNSLLSLWSHQLLADTLQRGSVSLMPRDTSFRLAALGIIFRSSGGAGTRVSKSCSLPRHVDTSKAFIALMICHSWEQRCQSRLRGRGSAVWRFPRGGINPSFHKVFPLCLRFLCLCPAGLFTSSVSSLLPWLPAAKALLPAQLSPFPQDCRVLRVCLLRREDCGGGRAEAGRV